MFTKSQLLTTAAILAAASSVVAKPVVAKPVTGTTNVERKERASIPASRLAEKPSPAVPGHIHNVHRERHDHHDQPDHHVHSQGPHKKPHTDALAVDAAYPIDKRSFGKEVRKGFNFVERLAVRRDLLDEIEARAVADKKESTESAKASARVEIGTSNLHTPGAHHTHLERHEPATGKGLRKNREHVHPYGQNRDRHPHTPERSSEHKLDRRHFSKGAAFLHGVELGANVINSNQRRELWEELEARASESHGAKLRETVEANADVHAKTSARVEIGGHHPHSIKGQHEHEHQHQYQPDRHERGDQHRLAAHLPHHSAHLTEPASLRVGVKARQLEELEEIIARELGLMDDLE